MAAGFGGLAPARPGARKGATSALDVWSTDADRKKKNKKIKAKRPKKELTLMEQLLASVGAGPEEAGDSDSSSDDEEEAEEEEEATTGAARVGVGSGAGKPTPAGPTSKEGKLLYPHEFDRVSQWLSRRALERELNAKIVDCPAGCGESLLLEAAHVGAKGLRCAKCDALVCTKCGGVAEKDHACATVHLTDKEKKMMMKLKVRSPVTRR